MDESYGGLTNALQRFQEHEKSDTHRETTEELVTRSGGMNVMVQLSGHYEADTMFPRKMLLKLLLCILSMANAFTFASRSS